MVRILSIYSNFKKNSCFRTLSKLKNKFLILSLQKFEIIQESVKSSTPLKFESQMSPPIVNFRKVIHFLRKFSTILFQNYGDSDRFWQKRNWAFADLMTPDGSFNFDAKVKSFFYFSYIVVD